MNEASSSWLPKGFRHDAAPVVLLLPLRREALVVSYYDSLKEDEATGSVVEVTASDRPCS